MNPRERISEEKNKDYKFIWFHAQRLTIDVIQFYFYQIKMAQEYTSKCYYIVFPVKYFLSETGKNKFNEILLHRQFAFQYHLRNVTICCIKVPQFHNCVSLHTD